MSKTTCHMSKDVSIELVPDHTAIPMHRVGIHAGTAHHA